jgi:lysyl-tRNA synthetase class 1
VANVQVDMPEELIVPPAIEEIVRRFDVAKEPLNVGRVQDEIGKARGELKEPTPEQNLGAWAEHLAFGLSERHAGKSPWGTYFAPLGTAVDKDGKEHYFPDIAGTPPTVLLHWAMRARTLTNPVLKARYADLVWDMTPAMSGARRDPDMARLAIDAYIVSSSAPYRSEIYFRFAAVERALELAILLSDANRIDAARSSLMALHRESMKTKEGHWWRAFDRLMQEKRARVTDDEKKEMIGDLEQIVQKHSDPTPENFDPHITEMIAQRLIKYYSGQYQNDDVKRLYTVIAKTSENFAGLSDAMLASAVLQTAVDAYRNAGLQEDSARVRILMQQKIIESQKQMAPVGGEVTIKKDDVEKFLESVILPDLGQTFVRLAVEFLPKRSDLEQAVKKTLEEAPLMARITQKIMADDRVAAIVGSVEDDPYGRLFQQAKFTYSFSHLWLREAFHRAIEKHSLVPEHFVGWANRHGLFQDTGLLLHGVRAWFEGDPVKAVHVLVPQIEHALRTIAGQLGKPVTKAHPRVRGASVAINMGDILNSDEIAEYLGPDLTFYFLSLYADPRGLNLRNEVAHGLIDAESMHDHIVRLLIHSLLVLGLWKELAKTRR